MTTNNVDSSHEDRATFDRFLMSGRVLDSFAKESCTTQTVVAAEGGDEFAEQAEAPVRAVLAHYSRRIDARITRPMLTARDRESAILVLADQWDWFVNTSKLMCQIFIESADGQAQARTAANAFAEVRAGARLAGDADGEEISFLTSTVTSALALAETMTGEVPAHLLAQEVELHHRFGASCHLYALGTILLRASLHVDERTEIGLATAMELTRFGALRIYSSVRQAWELRRPAEQPLSELPFDGEDYRLAHAP